MKIDVSGTLVNVRPGTNGTRAGFLPRYGEAIQRNFFKDRTLISRRNKNAGKTCYETMYHRLDATARIFITPRLSLEKLLGDNKPLYFRRAFADSAEF